MRIVFYTHYFPPEGNAPASRTYENCRHWARAGHDVRVVTCAPNVPDGVVYKGYRNKLYQRELVDGIEVIRLWTYIAANKGTALRIVNYISYMASALIFSLFMRRADIYLATSPQFFCGWAGLLASKIRRTPFILEIRDIWPESITALGAIQNKKFLRLLEWLEAKMYRWSPQIVTVGEGYRQRLIEKGVPENKMAIVMNGVDRELFYPRRPNKALQDKYQLRQKFVCSYVGTIGMACGLEVVLEAAELLRKKKRGAIVFLLVGDGASREALEEETRRRQLQDLIIFTGRQDKKMIPEFLALSNACLVHLRATDLFTTVMPSKIFEAAGMGRPIINGVSGFAEQIVKDAQAGICIEPGNAEQLVEALEKLAGDRSLARGLGRAGYAWVTRHFDRHRLALDYLKLIQQAHDRQRNRRMQAKAVEELTEAGIQERQTR